MMRGLSKMLAIMALAALVAVSSATSVFAAEGVDWNDQVITVQGMGVPPANTVNAAQARMLARRAAVVDGYRQLAEAVKGVNVDSETTVENMMVTNDTTKTKVSACIQGARVVSEQVVEGGYMVTMQVSMFGVSNSLASAVLEMPAAVENFPKPDASVAPNVPASVQVNVQVGGQPAAATLPAVSSTPVQQQTQRSSASAAPSSGQAIGGYTGLFVDCSGLGLRTVMSPVIKIANGQPIYGYKNLDYTAVVTNGMAGYTNDIHKATRAGNNPLVVKAVSLDGHNGNPVLSVADANRVLIENGATGFLDRTAVVFVH